MMSSVLTVVFMSGTFNGGQPVSFSISGVAAPVIAVSASTSASAALTDSTGAVVAASAAASLPAVVDSIVSLAITLSKCFGGHHD